MKQNCLDIQHLSCGYGKEFRLQDVNVTLPKGYFMGIIGRNGSGKSTLFKGVLGDLPLLDGRIDFEGTDMSALTLRQKARRIAVVSPMLEVAPITVEEYVLMGRIPHRHRFQLSYSHYDKEVANRYLELAGIDHLRYKYLNELSSGQQQLAAIASAFTQQPALLLLDEPTSHLDITYQVKIMKMLKTLIQEKELTVLMIMHDLNLASAYCDWLVLMKDGAVLKQGLPEQVITHDHIAKAYDTSVIIETHPSTGRPMIFIT